jgi:type IV secretion system protein VirB1
MDLPTLIQQCVQGVHPQTITAIIKQESGGNWLAMNIDGRTVKAKDYDEAVQIQTRAIREGRSIDTGLMQINSRWLKKFKIDSVRLFEPCVNLQLGSWILKENYSVTYAKSGNQKQALIGALSMYNTGSATRGYSYVNNVVYKAIKARPLHLQISTNIATQNEVMATPRTAKTSFTMQTKKAEKQ